MALESIDTGLRHVRCLELWEQEGWRIKVYGMGLTPAPPPESLLDEGRRLLSRTLPRPDTNEARHGVGFATVHAGEEGHYVLIDWWEQGDLLKHHLFGKPRNASGPLVYGWPRGVMGCIWEMAVPWFERNAWYRHVLCQSAGPNLDAYLAERLEGTV